MNTAIPLRSARYVWIATLWLILFYWLGLLTFAAYNTARFECRGVYICPPRMFTRLTEGVSAIVFLLRGQFGNEVVNPTVSDRIRGDLTYRPKNPGLMEALEKSSGWHWSLPRAGGAPGPGSGGSHSADTSMSSGLESKRSSASGRHFILEKFAVTPASSSDVIERRLRLH